MTMQNKQMIVVLYCTLIDYVVLLSKYVQYLQYNRAHEYHRARVGEDIDMWLSHFFTTRELVS